MEKNEQADTKERRSQAASKMERVDFKAEFQQIEDEKLALNMEYQRQQQLLDIRMEAVEIASKTSRSSIRRDDAYKPLSKENDVMKWINDIPVEDNRSGDNQLRRSWDKDGEARECKDQADIGAMKNDCGYIGRRDGDERFGMIKHIEEQAVNEETKASQRHNSRQQTGGGDQSRKMTGYGGDFTRSSTNKNNRHEEPREASNGKV